MFKDQTRTLGIKTVTPLQQFAKILWDYDAKHIEKEKKNPKYYRNPYAVMHYSEALKRAEGMIADPASLEQTITAITKCFEPSFWPVKKFLKQNGKSD